MLKDGSTLTLRNVRPAGAWACGTRMSATMPLPDGQTGPVTVYLDRAGKLVSINTQSTGNEKLYEADPSKECVINRVTRQREMLTDAEYKKLEKEAGP